MLLSGSSKTLGLASGVTEMYGAGTEVERRYLISSWKRLSSWYPAKFSWWCLHQIRFLKLGLRVTECTKYFLENTRKQLTQFIYYSPNEYKLVAISILGQNTVAFSTDELNSNQHRGWETHDRHKTLRVYSIYSEILGKPRFFASLLLFWMLKREQKHICLLEQCIKLNSSGNSKFFGHKWCC